MELCRELGWLTDACLETSPVAPPSTLARFHTVEYIAALESADALQHVTPVVRERHHIGNFENPVFPGVYRKAATAVGGSIHAARLALAGEVAFHPAGGTHHGRPDRASGFCYFNDPVFALLELEHHGVGRLLYVDLDAHHCDAVQDAFRDDPRVATLSIHEQGRWPGTGTVDDRGGGRSRNLPVPAGFHDAELRFLLDEVVLPFGSAHSPEAVVITCGTDALDGDPLTGLALSNVALWDAVDAVRQLAPVTVVLGGGGYNPWTLARCWTGLWARLAGHELPATLPDRAQALLAGLSCDLVDDEELRPAWLTTLADVPTRGSIRPDIATIAAAAMRP